MTDLVERVAKAIEASARTFSSPVNFYVEPEARERWEAANPDADYPPDDIDFDLESWKILARAALEAISGEPELPPLTTEQTRMIVESIAAQNK